MPDNGLIQKKDAHEMAHGRPVFLLRVPNSHYTLLSV